MRLFLLLVICCFKPLYARSDSLNTCKPIAIQDNKIILDTKKPSLIILHSLSKKNLWLTHLVSKPSASAGWSSLIEPEKWSAFALRKPTFTLSCIESQPGHEQEISCKAAVSVCAWPLENTSSVAKGSAFWAAENLNFDDLVEHLTSRGFKLPNSTQEMIDLK